MGSERVPVASRYTGLGLRAGGPKGADCIRDSVIGRNCAHEARIVFLVVQLSRGTARTGISTPLHRLHVCKRPRLEFQRRYLQYETWSRSRTPAMMA
eukprot:245214-Prymnesium_polylepis.1